MANPYENSNGPYWHTIPVSVWAVALCTLLGAIVMHLVLRQGFLDNMDERNYLWMADRILEGRVTAEPHPQGIAEHFTVYRRGENGDYQYAVFPVGWPLLLTLGRALSVPWAINPILASLAVLLTYTLANALYSAFAI